MESDTKRERCSWLCSVYGSFLDLRSVRGNTFKVRISLASAFREYLPPAFRRRKQKAYS